MLGGRTLWPPYLGPSVSIRQLDRHSPLCHAPSPLGHQVPTRVLHYAALPGQCLETSPEEATERGREGAKEGSGFPKKKKNPDPISIKILPLSRGNHWAASALLGKVMGLWDGDSSTHLSNHIHGQLTMIPTFLLVSLSVFIFCSSRSSTFKSTCCLCDIYPSVRCSSLKGRFLHLWISSSQYKQLDNLKNKSPIATRWNTNYK